MIDIDERQMIDRQMTNRWRGTVYETLTFTKHVHSYSILSYPASLSAVDCNTVSGSATPRVSVTLPWTTSTWHEDREAELTAQTGKPQRRPSHPFPWLLLTRSVNLVWTPAPAWPPSHLHPRLSRPTLQPTPSPPSNRPASALLPMTLSAS